METPYKDNMKKIGIVTLYYNNYNYGGQLQAFAMQKLFSYEEYQSELVAFETNRQTYVIQRLKDLGIYKTLKSIKNKVCFKLLLLNNDFNKKIQLKKERFDEFIDSIPHTKLYSEKTIKSIENDFDAFVCGSDQIWNPGWWNDILFLSFTNKPKFSYAASIARAKLTEKELIHFRKKIKKYIGISVREKQAKELIDNNTNCNIKVSLDPTLLIDRKCWIDIADFPQTSGKYVLFYMVGDSKGLKKKVYIECKKLGYNVFSIGFSKNTYFSSDVKYSDYVIKDAGPRQWLGWVANAEIIFTDSFHGSVFSILFRREFWCFERDNPNDSLNENSRLYHFLSITGLDSRLLGYHTDLKIVNSKKVDFDKVDENLKKYREQSLMYINDCLKQV